MLIGVHMANSDVTEDDLALFRRGRFKAAKLMWYTDPAALLPLAERGASEFMVRLPDSVMPDGRIPSYQDYAAECIRYIRAWYEVGVSTFQVDNEPNLLSWGREPFTPYDYGWFMGNVLAEVRPAVPADVSLGLSPLSWTALDDAGKALWLKALRPVAQRFGFVTVNSYWQSYTGNSMLWLQFGGNAQVFHEWVPDKPIVIGEWGNSLCQVAAPNTPPQATVEACMVAQYPKWLAWAGSLGYVQAAYVFILGGTDDWLGFRVGEAVADAIAPLGREQRAHSRNGLRVI